MGKEIPKAAKLTGFGGLCAAFGWRWEEFLLWIMRRAGAMCQGRSKTRPVPRQNTIGAQEWLWFSHWRQFGRRFLIEDAPRRAIESEVERFSRNQRAPSTRRFSSTRVRMDRSGIQAARS